MSSEAAENYGSTDSLEAGGSDKLIDKVGNSSGLTACLIVADVVGAGILGLPVAVAQIGWLPGVVLILLLLAMNVHTSLLMWRIRMDFSDVHTYSDMIAAAFSKAPEGERKRVETIGGICQFVFICSMLGIYVLTAGRAVGHVFYSFYVCLPTWTLLACCIILPFHATARRLGTWKNLVWLNIATICGACVLPLIYMWQQGLDHSRPPDSHVVAVAPFSFQSAFAALSTFTFGFTGQFMMIEIISEMKDASEFPSAYVYKSAPFQAAAFLLVGIGGYYLIGDKAQGMIGDNLAFGPVFQGTFACLVVQMVVTYLIKGIVVSKGIHRYIDQDADQDDSPAAWTTWSIIVLLVAFFSWMISSIIPFFNDFVDLAGASVTPVCCYIVPIVCYYRWVKDFHSDENRITTFEGTILAVEMIFAVMLLTVGTYFSMRHIMQSWDTYGPPFACHCEGMWNNCACSADHAGMFQQCRLAASSVSLQVEDMVDRNFAWMLHRFGGVSVKGA